MGKEVIRHLNTHHPSPITHLWSKKNMTTVTYTVPNISCGHCVRTIQNEVAELEGVRAVKADLGTKSVEITFDAPATEEAIKALLAEINYPVA